MRLCANDLSHRRLSSSTSVQLLRRGRAAATDEGEEQTEADGGRTPTSPASRRVTTFIPSLGEAENII